MADRQGGEDLVAAFARWTANQRVGAAAADRARERSLRDQASASATWVGILVDLAEQATLVTVVAASQRRRGRVVGVGPNFCVFQPLLAGPILICLHAISTLWPEPMSSEPASTGPGSTGPGSTGPAWTGTRSRPSAGLFASRGDRDPAVDLSLMAALSMLAEEHAPVALVTTAGDETAGDLVAVGEDVLTIRTSPPVRRLAYVPVPALALCELR